MFFGCQCLLTTTGAGAGAGAGVGAALTAGAGATSGTGTDECGFKKIIVPMINPAASKIARTNFVLITLACARIDNKAATRNLR